MRTFEIPKSDAALPKTIIATIIWMGIGLFTLNAISGRRVLECDRASGIIQCHLTTKQWLAEKTEQTFDGAKLQRAIVKSQSPLRGIGRRHQATLVTTQGDFWITPMDTEQFNEKHQMVDQINAFLEDPQSSKLKIESAYSSLFWIGTGILMAGFAILSFGVVMSWKFRTSVVGNQQLFDPKVKIDDYEDSHHIQVNVQKSSQPPRPKTDSKPKA